VARALRALLTRRRGRQAPPRRGRRAAARRYRAARAARPGKDAPPVRVKRDDLVITVEVTGELAAIHAADIGVPPVRNMWDFKIAFLAPRAPGEKGDPIVAFDTQNLEKNWKRRAPSSTRRRSRSSAKETDLAIQTDAQTLALAEAEGSSASPGSRPRSR